VRRVAARKLREAILAELQRRLKNCTLKRFGTANVAIPDVRESD